MIQNYISGIAILTSTTIVINGYPSLAKPITYDFTVKVSEGSLAGNTYQGSFSYDDETLSGVGKEEIGVMDGLTVNMNYFGKDYTEEDDRDYPKFPKLVLEDGEVQQLDFWIESNERRLWWGTPGWEVELSPRSSQTTGIQTFCFFLSFR